MKKRTTDIGKFEALDILINARAPIGGDFHKLPSSIVEELISAAIEYGYRKPKNANGSRGRYFHEFLQRKAAD